MNTPNYVAGFDESGHRLVTILCEYDPADPSNESLLKADKEKAAKLASDATVIELIDQATFEQYMDNCVRDMETGKPIPYVAPEPTDAEKKEAEKASLQATYESDKATLEQYYLSALASGDTDMQAEIQSEIAELDAQFDADIKALD